MTLELKNVAKRVGADMHIYPTDLRFERGSFNVLLGTTLAGADLVLLDEPLANLDFKLREELREELPRLFHDRDCIVVYATTEPTEALLFGGNTAAMQEGRVTQFGPTGEIYRRPRDLTTARVFSEPPINVADVTKTGNQFTLDGAINWHATGNLTSLPDGRYTFGIRPHHVTPAKPSGESVKVNGSVKVAELSGSESIIHFDMLGNPWVSLTAGIHPYFAGEKAELYMDVAHGFYFAADGKLIGM
jgi:glycerol transport system ATP-binding protein